MHRAERLTSEKQDKTKEVAHTKRFLKMNGYKPCILTPCNQRETKRTSTPWKSTKDNMHRTLVGCLNSWQGFSQTHQHPEVPARAPERQKDKAAKRGVVYDIQHLGYNQHYIDETATSLDKRIIEHLPCRHHLSAVSEHKLNTGHQCSMKELQILDFEERCHRRKIKETVRIRNGRPALDKDIGQELPPVMLQLVSHDVSHVT